MDDKNVKIVLSATDQTGTAIGSVGRNLDTLQGKVQSMGPTFRGMAIIGTAAFAALSAGLYSVIKAGANFEQTQIAFETMLGSAEKAKTLLKELTDFASKTPFQLTQIEQATKQLLAYGIVQEDIIPTLKNLGNIASGVGMDKMPQLIMAFGQVRAATKLTGMELRQFTEAGVPLLQALTDQANKLGGVMTSTGATSDKTKKAIASLTEKIKDQEYRMKLLTQHGKDQGMTWEKLRHDYSENKAELASLGSVTEGTMARVKVSVKDMIDKISEGEVTFDQVKEALAGMSGEGGKFFNLMEKQSQSLGGLFSNLQDEIEKVARSIGTALLPVLKPIAEKLIELTQGIGAFAAEHPKLTAYVLIAVTALAGLVAVIGTLGLILPSLIAGFAFLGTTLAFLAANPIVLVVAGLAFLVLKFNELIEVTGGFSNAVSAMGDTIISWWKSSGEWIYNKLTDLLNLFNKLISAAGDFVGGKISSVVSKIKGKASGGPVNPGTSYLVGESGPEFFRPKVAGDIISNGRGGGGQTVIINITGNTLLDMFAAEKIGDLIISRLKLSTRI